MIAGKNIWVILDSTTNEVGIRIKFNPGFTLTFVRRNCRLPLYHVMIAFGRDPALSQRISYRLSATNCDGLSNMSTANGRTIGGGGRKKQQ